MILTEIERATATHRVAGIAPLCEQRVPGKARGVQVQREERTEGDGSSGEGQVLVVEPGQRKRPKTLESACACADRQVQATRTKKQEEKNTHVQKQHKTSVRSTLDRKSSLPFGRSFKMRDYSKMLAHRPSPKRIQMNIFVRVHAIHHRWRGQTWGSRGP